MSKDQVVAQLKGLAQIAGKDFVEDMIQYVQEGKSPRLEELAAELTDLKIEAMTSDDDGDRLLYVEMIEDKIGSMAHVAATEGIVKDAELGAILSSAAKTMLAGFAVVAKPIIKVSLNAALGGVGGTILGGLGDKLVDTAVDAVVDKLTPE